MPKYLFFWLLVSFTLLISGLTVGDHRALTTSPQRWGCFRMYMKKGQSRVLRSWRLLDTLCRISTVVMLPFYTLEWLFEWPSLWVSIKRSTSQAPVHSHRLRRHSIRKIASTAVASGGLSTAWTVSYPSNQVIRSPSRTRTLESLFPPGRPKKQNTVQPWSFVITPNYPVYSAKSTRPSTADPQSRLPGQAKHSCHLYKALSTICPPGIEASRTNSASTPLASTSVVRV